MTKRIIVGYDDSGPSRRALEWAVNRAVKEHTPVLLAHVRTGEGAADADVGAAVTEEAAADARQRHPGQSIVARVLDGDVVPALLDLVSSDDVLVIGTHKTGHLYGRSLGTTGLAVATAAPCTVVVVPDIDLRFRRGVVAGIDTRRDAIDVSEAAAIEAERRGDELVLIRAGSPDRDGTDPLAIEGGRLQDAHPALPVSCRTTSRAVAPTLLDAALGHALLVIGARHPSDIRAGHVSAVLHDVLINLTAPVLVARHDGSDSHARSHLLKETA